MPLSPRTFVAVSRLFQRGLRPLLAASLLACALAPAAAQVASTEVVFLRHTNALVTTTVGQLGSEPEARTFITGLATGQIMVALDTRPQTQGLFGLAVDVVANSLQLYHLHPGTGAATAVAPAFQIHGFSGQPVFFHLHPWDMDYDPKTDTLRVIQGTLNFRIHATTGLPVDTHAGNAGNQPDPALTGNLEGCAYTNSQPDAAQTTLCTLDPSTGQLQIRSPENATVLTVTKPLTVAGVPLQFDGVSGFDIAPGVNVTQDGAAPYGFGYAILHAADQFTLYRIHLATGEATAVTPVASRPISFTFRPRLSVAVALEGFAHNEIRTFSPTEVDHPTVSRSVTGITSGETLVAIDVHPTTGQLYGLGVNALAESATLYLIGPREGSAIPVGVRRGIAYVQSNGLPVNLPDTGSYDMDFHPVTREVHVVVAVSNTLSLRFRLQGDTGVPIDGDEGGTTGSMAGVNADAPVDYSFHGIAFAVSTPLPPTAYGLSYPISSVFSLSTPTAVLRSNERTLTNGGGDAQVIQSASSLDIYSENTLADPDGAGTPMGLFNTTTLEGNRVYRVNLTTGHVTELAPSPSYLRGIAVFSMPLRGSLTLPFLPTGYVGQDYASYLEIQPGTQLTVKGLPPGLRLTTQTSTATLSGRLIIPGTYVITFTAKDSRGLQQTSQATLTINRLSQTTLGTFIAYIPPHPELNSGMGGRIDLTTTAKGNYSLKLTQNARSQLFKGYLTKSGGSGSNSVLFVRLKSNHGLFLEFDGSNTLTGQYADGNYPSQATAPIRGWRKIYDKINAPATHLAGYYTAAFTPQTDSRYVPQGDGFATLTIGQDGSSRVVGKMPDGTAITCAAFIGGPAEVFVYAPLFQKRGSLFGSLPLSLPSGTPSLSGSLTYSKPVTRGRLYPEFIAYEPFTVTGGYLAPTASSSQVLGLPQASTPASLLFTRAGIEDSATVPDLLSSITYTAPKATLPLPGSLDNPGRVTLRIHPGNGQITGTFTLQDGKVKRTIKYQGLIIRRADQPQILGSGYFHLPQLPETGQTPATSPILSGLIQLTQ